MPRFLLHVIAGSVGAGIFYAVMPLLLAMGINSVLPFGFSALANTTQIKTFGVVSVLVLLPMTIISVVRSGRRMFFGASDGRPSLFGNAGSGTRAAGTYKRRTLVALGASLFALISAVALALHSSSSSPEQLEPLLVLYLCLLTIAAGLAAIEQNDLRRTANLGLLSGDT